MHCLWLVAAPTASTEYSGDCGLPSDPASGRITGMLHGFTIVLPLFCHCFAIFPSTRMQQLYVDNSPDHGLISNGSRKTLLLSTDSTRFLSFPIDCGMISSTKAFTSLRMGGFKKKQVYMTLSIGLIK